MNASVRRRVTGGRWRTGWVWPNFRRVVPPAAVALIVGAFVIFWAERRPQSAARIHSVDGMSALDALKVGLVQCVSMIPGTSRSGATIIGGMLLGLSRKAATGFSFFLAIPTLQRMNTYWLPQSE